MTFPKIEGFVVQEKLGSGSYSTVYKAYSKSGQKCVVAIKCIEKSRLKRSGSAVDNLITEIKLLKTLKHPHIVEMKDFSWDDKRIYIQTEYCNCGDLSRYIHHCGRVSERQCLLFLQQLACALQFLRDKDVVHMDLKPHNLLLHRIASGKIILKVADFGFAQHMSDEARNESIRGSPLYMAPEMILKEKTSDGQTGYDATVDLWSVGVIMYECLFGKAPYSSNSFKELMEKVKAKQRIEIPPHSAISPECADLLLRLLQHDPKKRISYEDFFTHEFLDLKHMPTKENYGKAVKLVKQAVELDGRRSYERAFHAYCEALSHLVPLVRLEADPVRRTGLRSRVDRYVRRAEQLQAYTCTARANAQPESVETVNNIQNNQHNSVTCCGFKKSPKLCSKSPHNTDEQDPRGTSDSTNSLADVPYPLSLMNLDGLDSNTPSTVNQSDVIAHQGKNLDRFQVLYEICTSTPALRSSLEVGRTAERYAGQGDYATAVQKYKAALDGLLAGLQNEPHGARRDMLIEKIDEWLLEAKSVKALLATAKLNTEKETEQVREQCCVQ